MITTKLICVNEETNKNNFNLSKRVKSCKTEGCTLSTIFRTCNSISPSQCFVLALFKGYMTLLFPTHRHTMWLRRYCPCERCKLRDTYNMQVQRSSTCISHTLMLKAF